MRKQNQNRRSRIYGFRTAHQHQETSVTKYTSSEIWSESLATSRGWQPPKSTVWHETDFPAAKKYIVPWIIYEKASTLSVAHTCYAIITACDAKHINYKTCEFYLFTVIRMKYMWPRLATHLWVGVFFRLLSVSGFAWCLRLKVNIIKRHIGEIKSPIYRLIALVNLFTTFICWKLHSLSSPFIIYT